MGRVPADVRFVLWASLCLCAGATVVLPYSLYLDHHGGGVPRKLADGSTVLDNHGVNTRISLRTYRIAKELASIGADVAILSGVGLAVVIMLAWHDRSCYRRGDPARHRPHRSQSLRRRSHRGKMTPYYRQVVRNHSHHPRNCGSLGQRSAVGTEGIPGQRPFVEIDVVLVSGRVEDIAFRAYGCAAAIASCSALTEMVKGTTLAYALAVTPETLSKALGGLPLRREYCPHVAVSALRNAIRNASHYMRSLAPP